MSKTRALEVLRDLGPLGALGVVSAGVVTVTYLTGTSGHLRVLDAGALAFLCANAVTALGLRLRRAPHRGDVLPFALMLAGVFVAAFGAFSRVLSAPVAVPSGVIAAAGALWLVGAGVVSFADDHRAARAAHRH